MPRAAAKATAPLRLDVRLGLKIRAHRVITGSTTQPVNRSMMTEAKALEWSQISAPIRVTRKISPPTVVGRKFPTN